MFALSAATTTWLLSILAALLSSAATYVLSRSGDRRRLAAEDERRWLNDRRTLYARYLTLVERLERDADSIACFLPHDEDAPAMEDDDERLVREMSQEWMECWDMELQPMLSEIELLCHTEGRGCRCKSGSWGACSSPSAPTPRTRRKQDHACHLQRPLAGPADGEGPARATAE